MDLGIHLFNLMQYLAGEVAWISAHVTVDGRDITPRDVHDATEPLGPVAGDHIHSYFAFHDGVIGVFDSRRDSVGVNERYGMEIVGSEGIVSLRGQYTVAWGVQGALSLLASLPTLLVFLFFQRYFIAGMTMGAVKG